jgi:hypothetical protein
MKAVIVVRGGRVETVYASHPSLDVTVIDHDEPDDNGDIIAQTAADLNERVAQQTLTEVYR